MIFFHAMGGSPFSWRPLGNCPVCL